MSIEFNPVNPKEEELISFRGVLTNHRTHEDGSVKRTNPHTFEYEIENPEGKRKKKIKRPALSIRIWREVGFGSIGFAEVTCFGEALDSAIELKLEPGDSIDAYGRYSVRVWEGDKVGRQDVPSLAVNGRLQIRRTPQPEVVPDI